MQAAMRVGAKRLCAGKPWRIERLYVGGQAGIGDSWAGSEWEKRNYLHIVTIALHRNIWDLPSHFSPPAPPIRVKIRLDSLASPRCEAGVTHNVLAPRSFRWRFFCMEDRAPVVSSTGIDQSSSTTTTSAVRKHEGRGAWVLTCYGICGLALFGVLAYFFSDFISH